MERKIALTGPILLASLVVISGCSSKSTKPIEPVYPAPVSAMALPQMKETPRGPSLTLDDVLFDFDSTALKTDAQPLVLQAKTYLNSNPQRIAVIEGHTDSTGDETYNQTLSQRRARVVRDALIAAGIDQSRITDTAFGETRPAATNETRTGRQINRRVEIVFEPTESR